MSRFRNLLTQRQLPRLLLTRGPRPSPTALHAAQPLIDLTASPNWDEIDDLAVDFDRKLESFMAFDDGSDGSERSWLTK